jgi:hypothetical protein
LKKNPKVAEHGQDRSKMDLLKGGVDVIIIIRNGAKTISLPNFVWET